MRKRNDNENHLLSDQNLRFTCGNMSSIREYGFRVVLNFRAMALILIQVLIRAITVICCSSFSTEGHPNRFPARVRPLKLQISFKFRHSREDLHGHFPVGLVRSTPPRARQ